VNVETVTLAYFSPTGTTRKILTAISEGLGAAETAHIDLTLPQSESQAPTEIRDELVLLGVPVYEGRVPKTVIPRLSRITADKVPAVIVVVYGNRDFDDALLEFTDLSKELGLLPIACGAFIGEHSFANEDRPLGLGRPDADDLKVAREFGAQIRAKMNGLDSVKEASLIKPPGNEPYREIDRSGLEDKAAVTKDEVCTLCGDCAPLCPVGAITIEDTVKTDNKACILCNACVKNCPTGARVVDDPMINKIANWVSKNFQARSEPQTFL